MCMDRVEGGVRKGLRLEEKCDAPFITYTHGALCLTRAMPAV